MVTETFEYFDETLPCIGYLAKPSETGRFPLVLVVHDWSGCNEFAKQTAEQLAQAGYLALAVDMFGKGKVGKSTEEKAARIQVFIDDRLLLLRRLKAALFAAKALKQVDDTRVAAIGFCFGGLCVLDLARSGESMNAVVSFHGLFLSTPYPIKKIEARILALHGYDDPMVTPEQMLHFANELTAAKADWQINAYGQTMHAFMNPQANDPALGTVYQPRTAKRAWAAMLMFLKDAFAI